MTIKYVQTQSDMYTLLYIPTLALVVQKSRSIYEDYSGAWDTLS